MIYKAFLRGTAMVPSGETGFQPISAACATTGNCTDMPSTIRSGFVARSSEGRMGCLTLPVPNATCRLSGALDGLDMVRPA